MTTLNEREHGYEAKYAHEEELRFLATARRDKLFAHWAGEQLGVPGAEIEALTHAALAVRDGPGHDERLLAHIEGVFAGHGRSVARAALVEELAQCAATAKAQLLGDRPIV